jgi:hypothetical protein
MVIGGEVSRRTHREPLLITDHAPPWSRVQETPCSVGAEPILPGDRQIGRTVGSSAASHGGDVTTDPPPGNDLRLLPVPSASVVRVTVTAPGHGRLRDPIFTKICRLQCQVSSNGEMTTRPRESAARDEWSRRR